MEESTNRKISNLEQENKQLLLHIMRIENRLKQIENKFRNIRQDLEAFKDLTSNRRFG